MAAAVEDGRIEGFAVRVLRSPAGELEAAFAPEVGMVGCSLRHRGQEVLGQRGGLRKYAETGSTMGIPLLHPWANRLSGLSYRVGGREVELDPERMPIRLDPGGLPIHGLLTASPHWSVLETAAEADCARLVARFDFGAHPDLLAGFPFEHELLQDVRLDDEQLSIATTLRATGEAAVPVSFGYHPYLCLPGLDRQDWEVTLPVRRRGVLDDRGIPTGESEPVTVPPGPLGDRTYDDLFDQLEPGPEFVLAGEGRRIGVRFDEGYPFAQVYAPQGQDLVCYEPMTAPTNALVSGRELPMVEPGDSYVARFSLRVT